LFLKRILKSPERRGFRGVFSQMKRRRMADMRFTLSVIMLSASCLAAAAQTTTVPQGTEHPGAACPPGAGRNAPTVGKESERTLSDQLAQSKGVICPPAGVDPQMHQTPPEGGAMKVIPPPGSPGGNPNVQPK
jgi:hypothetical protein